MRTHLALLRAINVAGHNRIAMADLRALVSGLGHDEVATYVQSGNVVFTTPERDTMLLAEAIEHELQTRLGVSAAVVVLSRNELARVIADNPFPQEASPRCLHAVFRGQDIQPERIEAIAEAQRRARLGGSRDEAAVVGRTVFLRTPDGLGRSRLAAYLARLDRSDGGTARNWATVTKLMALLEE